MDAPQREMPRYLCHKKVWALQIADLEISPEDGRAKITPKDDGYAPFMAAPGWGSRYHGGAEDQGYYIVYDDGYASWSPTKAFEDGYERL